MNFTKMHGIGNDYVYVNCFEEKVANPAQLAIMVSDRHFGIGSDGLILVCPSDIADVKMRMFNADGSESQMCGNGIRCIAKFTYDRKLAKGAGVFDVPGKSSFEKSLRVETGRGVLTLGLVVNDNDKVEKVCVNMGQPILKPEDIPVRLRGDKIVDEKVEIQGQKLKITCVSMGNPHAVFFCDDVAGIDLEQVGPVIENYPLFPQRINVHFVKVESKKEITMRTWERGSGITLACGTGACACAVAASLTGRCGREILAHLPGGDLELFWCSQDNCVYMTGPATEVFNGVL